MMAQIAHYLLEHWSELGTGARRPRSLQWMVINGGISIRSKLVCPLWFDNRQHPSLVVKFARYAQYNELLDVEYHALSELRPYLPDGRGAPRPLARFEVEGLLVTVETSMPGRTLRAHLREHPRDYVAHLKRLSPFGLWLSEMHLNAARPIGAEEFEQRVLAPMSAAAGELALSITEHAALGRLRELALNLAEGADLKKVYNHNDPGTTNLMVDNEGSFIGVIDWESGSDGLPAADLFYFLARFGFETRGVGRPDELRGFKELFFTEPGQLREPAKRGVQGAGELRPELALEWLRAYCRTINLDVRWLPVLFGLTWIFHARNERKRLLGLRSEGQIIHGKPATVSMTRTDRSELEHGHFRSQLRHYLTNIDSSLVMAMHRGEIP
jgi:hypothetical protein